MNVVPKDVLSRLVDLRELHEEIYLLDVTVFHIKELTSYVVLRAPTRREFDIYSGIEEFDPISASSMLINRCMLYPNDLGYDWLAGIDDYIISSIKDISKFTSEDALLQGVLDAREVAQTLDMCITAFICKAFPAFSPVDIDNMTFSEQMKYAAMAEQVLGKPIPYEGFFSEQGVPQAPAPPVPEGFQSHGPGAPRNPKLNAPPPEPSKETVITPDNVFSEMQKIQGFMNG